MTKLINLLLLLLSHSGMSNSLWPDGLQHASLPWTSPSSRACSDSCPLSWRCHPTILSSAVPFSSCHQSFPASGTFLMSQFFASGSQSVGASASVLPMNSQNWFPSGLTGLISLQSKGLWRVFSNIIVQRHLLQCSALFMVQLSHPYMSTRNTIALTRQTFVGKVTSLLF